MGSIKTKIYNVNGNRGLNGIKQDGPNSSLRGIYSYQFAELGKGKKKSALKKRGKKIARGKTIKKGHREKEEKKTGKRRKQWEKRGKQ